jgi:hypothetical protein
LAEVEEDEAAAGRALGAAEEADRAGAGATNEENIQDVRDKHVSVQKKQWKKIKTRNVMTEHNNRMHGPREPQQHRDCFT